MRRADSYAKGTRRALALLLLSRLSPVSIAFSGGLKPESCKQLFMIM